MAKIPSQQLILKKPFPSQNSSTTINSMQDRAKLLKSNKKKSLFNSNTQQETTDKNSELIRAISKESELISFTFERNTGSKEDKNSENFQEKQNLTKDSKDSEPRIQKKKPKKILQIISGIVFFNYVGF